MFPALTEFFNSLAVSFDLPILDWIQANLQSGFMDVAMPLITLLSEDGIFWMVLATILLLIPSQRRSGLGMWLALAMGLIICNMILKPLVGRIRPYDFQEQFNGVYIKLLIDGLSDNSFPSGHTIAAFEASVALLCGNKKLGIPAVIMAFLVAFSRLYLYVHYPTDVFASIILGAILAVIGYWIAGKIVKPRKKGKYEA